MKKVREGYKMTELGEIPEEWEVRQLEDVCEILDSYRKPIKASDREEMKGDIPYYGASGVIDWVNDYIFDEELILLGEDGENLNSRNTNLAFKVSGKSWVNNHAHVFKIADKSRDNIDFMVYYLEYKDYSKYIAGSAQPKITQAQCRKFLLPSPDLEEQEKIASILSTVDEQIDNVNGLIEKNKELKKGLMQQLLTKGIGHTKFKKSEVGEIPEEWEVKKIKDVASVIDSLHETPIYSDSGYSMIRVVDVNGKAIDTSYSKKVSADVFLKFTRKYKPKKDDIIMSRVGSYGLVSYIKDDEELCLGQNVVIITSNLCKKYLFYFLMSDYTRNNIEKVTVGSSQKTLSLANINDLTVLLPSLNEQVRIADIISTVDLKIEEYETKKQKFEELKKGLMQQLLTGKIRVN